MTHKEDKMFRLLRHIYSDIGDKRDGACPVCSTYTHKKWCWYPYLLDALNLPLDEFDKKFLEKEGDL